MGLPMAGHLARAGHRTTVYNRSAAKAVAWAAEFGGRSAATPREAAQGADIVFACVGNDDDLRSVVLGPRGAFAGMKPGAIFVDHTTASAEVRASSAPGGWRGLKFIDAPVSGGNLGAINGALTVMCGGDARPSRPSSRWRWRSRKPSLLGPNGAGQLAKMVNQIAIAGLVQGLAEAIAFGERAGLDMKAVLGVIGKGAAQSWQMDNRGPTMVDDQVRLRLRRRLDAQGPRPVPGRSAAQRRAPAGDGAGRPVLCRRARPPAATGWTPPA